MKNYRARVELATQSNNHPYIHAMNIFFTARNIVTASEFIMSTVSVLGFSDDDVTQIVEEKEK